MPGGVRNSGSAFATAFRKRRPLPQRDGHHRLQIVPRLSWEVKLSPDGNPCYHSGESERSAYERPLLFGRCLDKWKEGRDARGVSRVCLPLC